MSLPAYKRAAPHMAKWWKAYVPENGMVTKTLSPYRIDHVRPFVRGIPDAAKHKIVDNVLWVGPGLAFLVGTVTWGTSTYEAEVKKHRY